MVSVRFLLNTMRANIIFAGLLALSLGSAPSAASASQLRVVADPRVELISIIFRLAGNPEYNQARVDSYTADVEKQFRPFANHAVVNLARQLRNRAGVSYDACMSMAVQVSDAYELQPVVPFNPRPEGLDSRWSPATSDNFLKLARQFVKDTGFREFITQHEALYRTTSDRMKSLMEKEAHLEWFGEFFGGHADADFTLVLALLNGPECYGPHCKDASGKEQMFCVFGVWKTDADGMPDFSADMVPTVVHEFNHSYANPIINRHASELDPAGQKLFSYVVDQMKRQAYGNGHTMLCESLVRASVVRYELKFHGAEAASREIAHEYSRSFVWTKDLTELLADYESHRDQYPTLDSFSPRLIKFFNNYADQFAAKQAVDNAKRPKIVSINPTNGAENVDPTLKQIEVIFDRPMRQSWALVGGGPHCPKTTGKSHFEPDRKTWIVPVELQPDWSYDFMLNSDRFQGFQSADGVPLKPIEVHFTTGAAK